MAYLKLLTVTLLAVLLAGCLLLFVARLPALRRQAFDDPSVPFEGLVAGALVGVIMLGPRLGKYVMGKSRPIMGHNMPLAALGVFILWLGWFGFNPGSTTAASTDIAMIFVNTNLAAAAGAVVAMVTSWIKFGKPSALGAVTGMVAGLGTITPASGFVGPGGALVIGITAGIVCFMATNYLKRTLKIDDSLDVFPVHGVGGVLGTLCAGLFVGTLGGVGLAEGMTMAGQVWVQFIGVAATFAWCAVLTWIILKLIDAVVGLRVDSDEETQGLDIVLHDETGYNL